MVRLFVIVLFMTNFFIRDSRFLNKNDLDNDRDFVRQQLIDVCFTRRSKIPKGPVYYPSCKNMFTM